MSQDDPVRLREEGSAELRSLLRAAREDLPSEAVLAALRARLPLEPGGGPGGGPGGDTGPVAGGPAGDPGPVVGGPASGTGPVVGGPAGGAGPVVGGLVGGGLGWLLGAVGLLAGLGLAVNAWGPGAAGPGAPVADPTPIVAAPAPTATSPAPTGAAVTEAAPGPAGTGAAPTGPGAAATDLPGSLQGTEVGVQVGTAAVDVRGLPGPAVTTSTSAKQPDPQVDQAPEAEAGSAQVDVGAAVADLDAELRLIREAQRALAGAPGRALELATSHGERFPDGQLAQEREVVAIQALVALGRREEANTRAEAFRVRWPGSAHLRRIDVLLGG